MSAILIVVIVLGGGGVAVHDVPFASMHACEAAKQQIKADVPDEWTARVAFISLSCVPAK
jgi:hypothetical protein